MSGRWGDLSPEQEEALKQFTDAVSDLPNKPEDTGPYYLLWLRARSFNVEKALDMFRKHLQWRKALSVDTIHEWTPPEVLQKYFPGGLFGEDRDGNPVYHDFVGNLDTKALAKSAKSEDVRKLKIQQAEHVARMLKELSEKKGRCIDSLVLIQNMENLSYQRNFHWPSIKNAQQLLKMFADNYPERSKQIIVVNAPKAFPIVYNMFKNFIDEETRKKIVVLGGNWKEELQQYISPDQLPQAYGGTRCEPDSKCTEYINWGGDIPEKYFLSNLMETKGEMEKTTVKMMSTFQVEVEVDIPGTVISWEFLTADYDIGFGVYHKPVEMKNKKVHAGDMTEVISSQRVNSNDIPQSGIHQCEHTGTYVLRFDNTYSWTRSKELSYSVRVLPPDTELVHQEEERKEDEEEDTKEQEFTDCTEDPLV